MQYSELMIRYGELSTKGKNRGSFINQLVKNIRDSLAHLTGFKIAYDRDRCYVLLGAGVETQPFVDSLLKVFGIQAIRPVLKVEKDIQALKVASLQIFQDIYKSGMTFKIATRRSDHRFELDSVSLNQMLGDWIFEHFDYAETRMKQPDVTLKVEVRSDAIYLSYEEFRGAGGLPVGTAGRGTLMLSGGIDSPVAGYLALKRGVEIEAVHFASPPYTSPGALQKAKDLARKLTAFGGSIQFIEVPFTEIQEQIRDKAPQAYLMTLTRRFMLRLVDRIRAQREGKVIITGESLGQVASQTLGSLSVINAVTTTPIVRPVITMDKLEIIELAEKIDTFDLSILPFEDCCTVFAPPSPKTNPQLEKAELYEQKLDVEGLISRALDGLRITEIRQTEVEEVSQEFAALL